MKFFDRLLVSTATVGTGTLTLGAAASGNYLSATEAGVADGNQVTYVIEEGANFEIGTGVIGGSGTTLTRAAVYVSKIAGVVGVARMELAGTARVYVDDVAAVLNDFEARAGRFRQLAETIKTNDYTVDLAVDRGTMLVANKATAIVFNLPAVAGADQSALPFRNIGVGALTIDGNGSETIEGATTLVLQNGDSALLWPNAGASAWRAVVRRKTLPIAEGGTGATTAQAALNALLAGGTNFAASGAWYLTSTDDSANAGPSLNLRRLSPSPANSDLGPLFNLNMYNGSGLEKTMGQFYVQALDVTNGSEDAAFVFGAMTAGSVASCMTLTGTGINNTAIGATTRSSGLFTTGNFQTSLSVGTFSATGATYGKQISGAEMTLLSSVTGTGLGQHIWFYNANTLVGSVSTTGSATAYNTSSDARLKTDFRAFDSGPIIDAIIVYDYAWLAGGRAHGVKAQELDGVYPNAVSVGRGEPGEDGFVPMGVDYSKLVPVLVREVQMLRARLSAAGL